MRRLARWHRGPQTGPRTPAIAVITLVAMVCAAILEPGIAASTPDRDPGSFGSAQMVGLTLHAPDDATAGTAGELSSTGPAAATALPLPADTQKTLTPATLEPAALPAPAGADLGIDTLVNGLTIHGVINPDVPDPYGLNDVVKPLGDALSPAAPPSAAQAAQPPAPPAPTRVVRPLPDGGTWKVAPIVTWYGPGFYGGRTACGERYTRWIIGVAHKTLPCGTLIQFRWHGMTAVAPVIDRGPYAGPAYVFDFSAALACHVFKPRGETNSCYTRHDVQWRIVGRRRHH